MKSKFQYVTKGGRELEVELPARFVVCDRCEGRGTHVNPAIDGHGLTEDDFESDPDFKEGYFSGRYDVQCETCHGVRVVPEVDEERLSKKQKRFFDAIQKQQADHARWEAEDRRTRFWENGGRDG